MCTPNILLSPENLKLTQFYALSTLQNHPSSLGISIAGTIVQLLGNIKTLGVTLDSHLTLNSHISTVRKSAFYHT